MLPEGLERTSGARSVPLSPSVTGSTTGTVGGLVWRYMSRAQTMISAIASILCLSASYTQGGDHPGSASALLVQECFNALELPGSANVKIAVELERHLVPESSMAKSRAHYALARQACPGSAVMEDGAVVQYVSSDAVCVVNASIGPELQGRSERVQIADGRFLLQRYAGWRTAPHDVDGVREWAFYGGGDDVVRWDDRLDGAGRHTYYRSYREDIKHAYVGSLLTLSVAYERLSLALHEALRQDALNVLDDGFECFVSLQSPEELGRLEEVTIENGFRDTPGYVELRYQRVGRKATLSAKWRDCLDSVLFDEYIEWGDGLGIPSSLRQRMLMRGMVRFIVV